MASMHKLVDKYELNSKKPISLHNLSEKTLRQVKGVVGFQITIESIQAAYKLSQGREHDHERIIEELENTNNPNARDIANRMKE